MLIAKLGAAIGVPPDLLRIAFCILASFPLGSLVKRIPRSKQLLSDLAIVGIGLFYLVAVFPLAHGAFLMIVYSAITYALAMFFPRHPKMPWINFLLQMSLMLYTHCKEQFGNDDYVNNIGISGTQMIIIQKLTSYAWNVYDGTLDEAKLSENQKQMQIKKTPSFIRYLAWIFFFPTVMTGPACTFVEYDHWASGEVHENLIKKPRSTSLIARRLVEGVVWVLVYMQTSSFALDPQFYTRSWYASRSFLFKAFALWILGVLYRTKYYAAWTLSEAACIHVGISYNGVDESGQEKWDRMRNVSPMGVEFGQNIRGVLADWNIVTANWLRYYVYMRVTKPGKKPGVQATYITFLVSALWHGTRIGYYLTFATAACYQVFGRIFRKRLRPLFLNKFKPAYDVLTFFVTQLTLGFAAVPFMLLDFKPAMGVWSSVYFYAYVGMLISWLLLEGPLKKQTLTLLGSPKKTE